MRSFLEEIGARYGNDQAKFADGTLDPGQEVRVILDGEIENYQCVIVATYQRRGKFRIDINGRKWFVKIPRSRVLVEW